MSRWVGLDIVKKSWDIRSKLPPCQELTFNTTFWQQYKNYLSRLNNNDTTSDRLTYEKKYYDVLTTSFAMASILLGSIVGTSFPHEVNATRHIQAAENSGNLLEIS